MPKPEKVKRTLTLTLELEAPPGTTSKFFDSIARHIKKNPYVVDDVYDADPTDIVSNPGDGLSKVKLISVHVK